jgi:NAD(P)-dependent dehydrogenase (short-subunit alcohol dehydrogenase family)
MAPDTLSLEGKVAIVTGSGRENGMGAGIAFALARNGASVTINFVSDSVKSRAAGVAKKVEELGGKAAVVQVDISTPEGAATLVNETLKAFQTDKIDILGRSVPRHGKYCIADTDASLQSTMP